MCNKHRSKKSHGNKTTTTTALDRKRIWEVRPSLHCSILGTCLSMRELHAVARKGKVRFPLNATDHEIHGCFVEIVETQNAVSKLVDKALEKKYRVVAARFRRCPDIEALERCWEEAWKNNDIPGAYWAVLTHPMLTDELFRRAFGEVHMLSHLLGASRRTDIYKFQKLDAQCATLAGKLALVKTVFRKRLKSRDAAITEMQLRLSVLRDVERRLALAHETIFRLRRNSGAADLEKQVSELREELKTTAARAERAEAELVEAGKFIEQEMTMAGEAMDRIRELSEENAALEQELRSALTCHAEEPCEVMIENDGTRLCGRKIMYVGGRSNLVRYYRALVERRGGVFIHHDGGIESSMDLLKKAVNSADAVICPIDCVSHGACLTIKKTCKQMAKPFIPLRSAGLSSLAHGMHAIG